MSLYKNWPSWPKSLTQADWNKQKGIIAKVVKGETGIGAELTKSEKAYSKIVAGYFHEAVVDTESKEHLQKMLKSADAEIKGSVKDLKTEMARLAKFLSDKASPWASKTSPVPKSTRLHVEDMAKTALDFGKTVEQHCQASVKDMNDALAKLK